MRGRAFTVAFVGPDGAGKTTICRALCSQLPWPTRYIYMGINQEACNILLPTTWLWLRGKKLLGLHRSMGGPPPVAAAEPRPGFHPLRTVKSLLRTTNLLAEEWYRQLRCSLAVNAGKIVVMDRHFLLDYYAHHLSPTRQHLTLANRIHGFFLRRLPVPDLIIFLDAAAESLYQRKPEGTTAALESRRQEYWKLRSHFPQSATIDATQPLEVVVRNVTELITAFHKNRTVVSPPASNRFSSRAAVAP